MVCEVCGEVLENEYIEIGELRFHEDHFRCSVCQQGLVSKKFKFTNQTLFCSSCK